MPWRIAGFTTTADLAELLRDELLRAEQPPGRRSRGVLLVVDLDLGGSDADEQQATLLTAGALLAGTFGDADALAQCGQRLVVLTDDHRLDDTVVRRLRHELTIRVGMANPLVWTDDVPAAADADRYLRDLSPDDDG